MKKLQDLFKTQFDKIPDETFEKIEEDGEVYYSKNLQKPEANIFNQVIVHQGNYLSKRGELREAKLITFFSPDIDYDEQEISKLIASIDKIYKRIPDTYIWEGDNYLIKLDCAISNYDLEIMIKF